MIDGDFAYGFDWPQRWSLRSRRLVIRGWCSRTSPDPVCGIRVRVGNRIWPAVHGLHRPDIRFAFPHLPNAGHSGFEAEISVPTLPRKLTLEALSQKGEWQPFFGRTISRWRKILPKRKAVAGYAEWVSRYDTLSDADRRAILARVDQLQHRPLISVLLPTFNTPREFLIRSIDSVRNQLYPNWQLCIADDASTNPDVRQVLEQYAQNERIRVIFRKQNGHISAATNSALDLATGEFIALLDHDDELSPHALYMVAEELNSHPEADLLYSDEDKIDVNGRRFAPYFKPAWNPDLLLAQNYINHLAVYRAALVKRVGGFREGYEGAQDYDLLLRCTELTGNIRHIPHVLYHWRTIPGSAAAKTDAKPYATGAARRAIEDSMKRRNIRAAVMASAVCPDYHRVRYETIDPPPLVSLIIPTQNRVDLLSKCVESILARTSYSNYEVLIIDNDSDDPAALEYLQRLRANPTIRIAQFRGPFNYSAINNFGVRESRGQVVGLMNNDVEVLDGDWLNELVSQTLRPGIGAVGCKLLFPNRKIQHAGIILGAKGIAEHAFKALAENYRGEYGRACLSWNVSGLTGACLFVRREVYWQAGGLDEQNLQVAFNDLDLCLKILTQGHRNVYTPYACLYHYESASRGYEDSPAKRVRFEREAEYFKAKWKNVLPVDPAYNPNLDLGTELFQLAWPPRRCFPWQTSINACSPTHISAFDLSSSIHEKAS